MVDFEELEKRIKEKGLTVAATEREAGLGNGVIGGWRNRQNSPNVTSLQKVAVTLGCTVDDLLQAPDGTKPGEEGEET